MKALLWICTFFLLPVIAHARGGGDEVGNGGGIAENGFVFSYANLGSYLKLCLDFGPACAQDTGEARLIGEILASLGDEYRNPRQLQFVSERERPGFFIIDGRLKIAKTGDAVGSPVYVNLDLLYRRDEATGEITPLPYEAAISVLVHELGHHHGVTDHAWLDQVGARVGSLMAGRITRTDAGPRRRHLVTTLVDLNGALNGGAGSASQLLLSDGVQSFDLTERVRASIACPGSGARPDGFTLFNPHWLRYAPPSLEVTLDLVLSCDGALVEGQQLDIELGLRDDARGTSRIVDESLRISQRNISSSASNSRRIP